MNNYFPYFSSNSVSAEKMCIWGGIIQFYKDTFFSWKYFTMEMQVRREGSRLPQCSCGDIRQHRELNQLGFSASLNLFSQQWVLAASVLASTAYSMNLLYFTISFLYDQQTYGLFWAWLMSIGNNRFEDNPLKPIGFTVLLGTKFSILYSFVLRGRWKVSCWLVSTIWYRQLWKHPQILSTSCQFLFFLFCEIHLYSIATW